MYKDLIHDLRRYGLSNGTALGRHMGIMDEAADAIETLTFELEAANKRADAAVEEICLKCHTRAAEFNLEVKSEHCAQCKWRGKQEGKGEEG